MTRPINPLIRPIMPTAQARQARREADRALPAVRSKVADALSAETPVGPAAIVNLSPEARVKLSSAPKVAGSTAPQATRSSAPEVTAATVAASAGLVGWKAGLFNTRKQR